VNEAAITTRPMTGEDVPAIVDLLNAALGPAPAGVDRRTLFEWKHHANPAGPSIAIVAEMDRRIVGLRSFMRWTLRAPEGDITAVRAVDTATSPAVQRRGIFSRLSTEALERCRDDGVAFVFNTPNDKSRPGYLKMGWQVVTTWPMSVKVRRFDRLAIAALRRDLRSGPGVAPPPASAMVAAETALATAPQHLSEPEGLHTPRTPAYLRWRYTEGPMAYHALAGDAALVIVRLRERGPLREAVVCEALCAPGAERELGDLLRRVANEAGADHAVAHVGQGWAAGALLSRAGFRRLPRGGMTFTVKPLTDRGVDPLLAANWALTLGDLEVF
jgi:GNAT superfamily N-acetyltransferase